MTIRFPLSYVLYNLESMAQKLPKQISTLRKMIDVIIDKIGQDEWSRMNKADELLNPSILESTLSHAETA